ncbi:MAG: phosphatase PAP2 family protein [Terracidiphilus sp.]
MKAILLNPALIGTLALFLAAIWMVRGPRDKTRPLLVFALVLNLFYGFLLTVFMEREGSLFPWKFDHVLFRMDESLGLQAVWLARPLQEFRVPLWVVYQAMVPMMICWFLVTRYRNQRGSVIPAYAAELAAGPLMYALLPACGPVYAFGKQWLHPPAVVQANAIRLSGMPNAFPSLHVATALVFVFFAPGRLWRAVSLAFLAATCLATLSTGEHYVIDLIPGLAFGSFAACVGLARYRRALVFLAVVCAWSFAVRLESPFLIGHPLATRACAAFTIFFAGFEVFKEWTVRSLPASSPAITPQPAAL